MFGLVYIVHRNSSQFPYFLIPNVTISERMEPLIGINITTVNQWSMRFEYKKSRILSLSLIDYQLSENNSKEWVNNVTTL